MGNVKVVVSKDRFEARITIHKNGKVFPTKAELYEAIKKAGVVFGIDEDFLDRLITEQEPVYMEVFARGYPPEKGEDAKLVWYTDVNSASRPLITEEGKADFKQLRKFEPVEKGQELVSKLPLTYGTQGKTVIGETIVLPGRDISLPVGNNTRVSDDGLTLCAEIDGYTFWDSGTVNVDNVYYIKGDVDFSTGNVEFDGSIFINGDVRSGFRVDATNAIYIDGNVEAASVYSEKGDIFIKLGILGKGRAKILTGGSLHCGYSQDATISVKKNIVIDHYAINSSISSGGRVFIAHNEGLIRGGKVFAERGVEAVEVGSIHDKKTEIGISRSDHYEVISEKINIKNDIEKLNLKAVTLNKRTAFLNLLKNRLKILSPEKQRLLAETKSEVKNIEKEILATEVMLRDLVQRNSQQDVSESIVVRQKLHRGVTIKIGNLQHYTEKMFQGVKIYLEGEKILIGSLPVI